MSAVPVRVLTDPRGPRVREGWVERVTRRGGRVRVELLLDDGAAAFAELDADEAAWLELRVGSIVDVEPSG